ncbi:MAG: GAF domain-containing protein [Firmicutes bacterium]|nr:GAF domain-containing protein [Bacillota bacterium]
MQKNDFLCINNIIYLIYNEPDFLAMRRQVLELVQTLIPCAFASFMTAGRGAGGLLLADPVCRPAEMEVEQAYQRIQYEDYSRWLLFGGRSTVVRASDLLPEAERERTLYYQTCLAPFGLHYVADAALAKDGRTLGVLSLYRRREQGDFSDEELFLMQALCEHLAARFYLECGECGDGGDCRDSGDGGKAAAESAGPRTARDEFCRARGLTRREVQVLDALLRGEDTAAVSEELCISPHTLKKHQQSIYRKCGVSSRAALDALCRAL